MSLKSRNESQVQSYQEIILDQETQITDYKLRIELLTKRLIELQYSQNHPHRDSPHYSEDYENFSSNQSGSSEEEEEDDDDYEPEPTIERPIRDLGISEQAEQLDHIEITHTEDGRIQCNMIWKGGAKTEEIIKKRDFPRRCAPEEIIEVSQLEDDTLSDHHE